jgi:hypothetical protein
MDTRAQIPAAAPSGIVPDPILPVHLAGLRVRSTTLSPELKLVAAVLEDAIQTFYRFMGSPSARGRMLLLEVREWFEYPDASSPITFEGACDALGVDAAVLRARLGLCDRAGYRIVA